MKEEISITSLFTRTAEATSRVVVNVGGAGSSKSYSIAQLIVHKFLTEPHKMIGVGRATMPSLKMTAYKLIVDVLKLYGLYTRVKENKTAHTIEYKGNTIQFFSTGGREANIERLKSTNFNYIWLEEANEFLWEDFLTIDLRLRAPTVREYNQIYLSLNPTNATGWIPVKLMKRKDVYVIHSTYQDNPFCSSDYIETLLNLMEQDENFYRIYALGEWGVLENLVFKKLDLNCRVPEHWDMMCYGLDFGFSPGWTALVKVMVVNQQTFYQERLYAQKLTNMDLIERLSHEERGDIYADNQEPARIEEIKRAGYVIYPATKDVKQGLDMMRREPLHITEDSINMIREVQNYQHKKDKDGNILEEVIKFNDHCFVAGTKVRVFGGEKSIEDMEIGDMVLTRKGFYPVMGCGLTMENAEVVKLKFEGGELVGTGNHPVWVKGKGFVDLSDLKQKDLLEGIKQELRDNREVSSIEKQNRQDVYNLTVDTVPEYYANGILVHNCIDAGRYGKMGMVTRYGFATAAPLIGSGMVTSY